MDHAEARARLREVITDLREQEAIKDRALDAIGAADRRVEESESKLETVQAAHLQAHSAAVDHLIGAALDGRSVVARTGANTLRALREAEDALALAKDVRSGLSRRRADAASKIERLLASRQLAIRQVVSTAPGIHALINQMAKIETDLIRSGLTLQWLVRQGYVAGSFERGAPHIGGSDATTHIRRFDAPPFSWAAVVQAVQKEPTPGWQQAIIALEQDADAALPGEPTLALDRRASA